MCVCVLIMSGVFYTMVARLHIDVYISHINVYRSAFAFLRDICGLNDSDCNCDLQSNQREIDQPFVNAIYSLDCGRFIFKSMDVAFLLIESFSCEKS